MARWVAGFMNESLERWWGFHEVESGTLRKTRRPARRPLPAGVAFNLPSEFVQLEGVGGWLGG